MESRDTLGYMRFAFKALENESKRAEKYLLNRSRAALMEKITIGESSFKNEILTPTLSGFEIFNDAA